MKLRAKVLRESNEGLQHVGEGDCDIYYIGPGPVADGFVTLHIGNFRIWINKEDFITFAKKFLYDRSEENVSILRQNFKNVLPASRR